MITAGRYPGVDRRQHRPAPLARVRYPAGEIVELGRAGQGVGREVDQPRSHDRTPSPHLGHLGHVDLVLVGLGVAQRRRLGVYLARLLAGIGVLDDGEALGDGGHHPVLDSVVDHLDEVPGAVRPAVQVAVGRRAVGAGAARRGLDVAFSGGDGLEDRVEPMHGHRLAADHEAVAPLEAPHTSARAAVDVVDALSSPAPWPGLMSSR